MKKRILEPSEYVRNSSEPHNIYFKNIIDKVNQFLCDELERRYIPISNNDISELLDDVGNIIEEDRMLVNNYYESHRLSVSDPKWSTQPFLRIITVNGDKKTPILYLCNVEPRMTTLLSVGDIVTMFVRYANENGKYYLDEDNLY